MRSRSTLVDPNAFPTCSDALSLNVFLPNCVYSFEQFSCLKPESPFGLPAGPACLPCLPCPPCLLCMRLCLPRIKHPRSSAKPSEARPTARSAAAAEGGRRRRRPRAARGPPSKARMRLNCRDSAAAYKLPWSAGKRALHVRDPHHRSFCEGMYWPQENRSPASNNT